ALTFLQMAASCIGFTILAVALGQFEVPRGWTVWGALLVTGIFAGALGYLIATWVQGRTTAARAALVFTLEAPFAALFGVLLAAAVARSDWHVNGLGPFVLAGVLSPCEADRAALRRRLGRRLRHARQPRALARGRLHGEPGAGRRRRARHRDASDRDVADR